MRAKISFSKCIQIVKECVPSHRRHVTATSSLQVCQRVRRIAKAAQCPRQQRRMHDKRATNGRRPRGELLDKHTGNPYSHQDSYTGA